MLRRHLLLAAAALLPLVGLSAANAQAAALPEEPTRLNDWRTLPVQAQRLREAGESFRADRIEDMIEVSELLQVFPFMDVAGGAYTYLQEGFLPGVAFEGDGAPSSSVGVVNPKVETLKIAGGDLDVDAALLKTHGVAVRRTQERMKAKAIGLSVTDMFINGDPADPRQPRGLKRRFVGPQSFDLRGGRLRVDDLDDAIDAVDYPTHIVCSKRTRNRLATSRALSGRIAWEFVTAPNGARYRAAFLRITENNKTRKLRIICTDHNERGEQIISHDENGRGTTSIYILSLGDTGVIGLQHSLPQIDDIGLTYADHRFNFAAEVDGIPAAEADKVWRTRIEWLVAPGVLSGRSGARLHGFQAGKAIL